MFHWFYSTRGSSVLGEIFGIGVKEKPQDRNRERQDKADGTFDSLQYVANPPLISIPGRTSSHDGHKYSSPLLCSVTFFG